jgi:NADH-quinone oxidoreductase subunit G
VDHNKDIVYRIRPRENPQAQGYFICDEGRFDYEYVNGKDRLDRPLARLDNGALAPAAWESAIPLLRGELTKAAANGPVAGVLSPMLTLEEAYLLAKLIKGLSADAKLYLGWVPVVGADEKFPQDRHGKPIGPVKFTIHAEKAPNRRGVEEILKHFQGEVLGFDRLIGDAASLKAIYLTAGYSPRLGAWANAEQTEALARTPLLIVQDLFASSVSAAARYVLPAASFAEKDGVFVNQANLAQQIHWAVKPGTLGRSDGQIFLDLMQRRGLIQASTIRQELAREVPAFAALAGDLGEHGVKL